MFCFQCEQTAGCKACGGNVGVCGKKADTAQLQDRLTGALIGLARATDGNEHLISQASTAVIVEGLFATLPAFVSSNVLNFLVETFGIAPITTPEADLKVILGN